VHLEPWWYLDDIELFAIGELYAYTMYHVWSYDELNDYMWFISEVEIDYGASGTEQSSWGRIKSIL
jgi:hypothetical protein